MALGATLCTPTHASKEKSEKNTIYKMLPTEKSAVSYCSFLRRLYKMPNPNHHMTNQAPKCVAVSLDKKGEGGRGHHT